LFYEEIFSCEQLYLQICAVNVNSVCYRCDKLRTVLKLYHAIVDYISESLIL